ncbi:MAG: MutS-related protein [Streptosporangiaceae bacterium]
MPDPDRRFHSILFEGAGDAARAEHSKQPSCFPDLNLDQAVAAMTGGRAEYRLTPFFYTPLTDQRTVEYRHDILRDLEHEATRQTVQAFGAGMRRMRERLAQASKLHYRYQQERWFAGAVDTYCQAVRSLTGELGRLDLGSRGFQGLTEYLTAYTASDAFTSLAARTQQLYRDLGTVSYSIHIKGNRVRVSKYDGEPDYSAQVEQTFAKFQPGAVQDYRVSFRDGPDMSHVEARILDLVARLYPDVFAELDEYTTRNQGYLDAVIGAFDREVQFYLAYLEFTAPLRRAGLPFCYPQVGTEARELSAAGSFDLALASKLVPARSPVVSNDFSLSGPERILVVTGPNNGGKTTFARMFGQLHYLASLGLPVPGRQAQLQLPDQVFTHFEREEDITTRHGKLADELTRIHQILRQAGTSSVLVMNESFTSTTLHDALFLGTEVMRRVTDLGPVCVYVTFVDELASLSQATVSMVAKIVPGQPAERPFKVVRRPADGLAYAAAMAAKYGLSYERVKERISR